MTFLAAEFPIFRRTLSEALILTKNQITFKLLSGKVVDFLKENLEKYRVLLLGSRSGNTINIENNNKVVAPFDSLNLVGVSIVSKIQLVACYQSCILIG